MEKDAEELSATDEEIQTALAQPSPPLASSSKRKHIGDQSSEEEEDDDVSGECPPKGMHYVILSFDHTTQSFLDVDITFDYPMEGGMVDSITLPSSISWVRFQEEMCTTMTLQIKELKLGYKFSTHPQCETPRILTIPAAFLKMKEDAAAQIHEQENTTGKGKKQKLKDNFRVILVDSGKKNCEKAIVVKGKVCVCTQCPLHKSNFIDFSRK